MEDSKDNGWGAAGFLLILLLISVAGHCINKEGRSQTKTQAVEEYLSHPERYQIQYKYNKGDTIAVDTIVNYLK